MAAAASLGLEGAARAASLGNGAAPFDGAGADCELSLFERLLEASVAVRVASFLELRDVARAARASRSTQPLFLEELVFRQLARRLFPGQIAPSFQPPDRSWVAELRFRREAARRTAAYQRALSQGNAGNQKSGPPLLRHAPPQRFAAFESEASEAAAARRLAAEAAEAVGLASPGGTTLVMHAHIDAASARGTSGAAVGRQGTATWASLGGSAFA